MMKTVENGEFQNLQTFLFIFSVTLIHEIGGHSLTSFLTRRKADTPDEIYTAEPGYGPEAGITIDNFLFGGYIRTL